MRPSKSRFTPSSRRPHRVFLSGLMEAFEGLDFPDPACSVKTATPDVTASTTAYLYNGYLLPKSVMWRNMTGSNLQDFARMNVM